MKRTAIIIVAIALGTAAYAGGGQPGSQFLEKWDMNEDGQVTLAEATERRGDIFFTFDENEDGFLSAQDYLAFDEARAADHEGKEFGGPGNSKGGHGNAGRASVGMELDFNDIDNDGQVSREEFLSRSADWFALLDRDGDGVVTPADFGRRG